MSKIEKMSIGEIFDSVQLMLRENDIIYFCRDEETIQEFSKLRVGNRVKREELREFLVTHEDKIDKEKLLLLVVKNYQDNIKTLERLEKEAAEQVLKQTLETEQNHFTELHNESLKYKTQLYVQKEQLQKAKKLAKGIGKCIVFYHYDPKDTI